MFNLSLMIWLSFLSICKAILHTGNFISSQSIYEFTYNTSTIAANANFQFYLTPFYSAALLIGKNTPFTPSTNREDWNHYDYLSDNSCDFQGMITGRNQYAFAKNLGIGTIIYLKIISLEPANTFNYTINITQGNLYLQSCPAGLIRQFSRYYCQFCDFGHVGSYCNVARHILNPSTQAATILSPKSYTYFQLQTVVQISLYLTFGNGVAIFIQVQQFNQQMAGNGHYLSSSLGQGKYVYTKDMSINMDLPQARTNYVIGIINPQSSTIGLTILFKQKEGANIMMIVIGVIGGLLFLGIVIGIIIILRKIRNSSRREVIPVESLNERHRSNRLTSDQLNFYFPALPLQQFYPHTSFEASITELKEEKLQEIDKLQCVICLCQIQSQDMARAGYCKHVFHSNCLILWFMKQQNCPYCRQNYERQPTKQFYKKLIFKAGKRLVGPQIPKNIFSRIEQMTMNTIQITDISGQTYEH